VELQCPSKSDEEAPPLETQLANIAAKYDALAAPTIKDKDMAASDLAALKPVFAEELAKVLAAQKAAEPTSAAYMAAAADASTLQAKMCCARDFHMLRIAECDAKVDRINTARALEEEAAKAAAAPPPEEE